MQSKFFVLFLFFQLIFSTGFSQENLVFPDRELMKKNKVKTISLVLLCYNFEGKISKANTEKFILEFDTMGLIQKSTNYIFPDTSRYNETYYYYNEKLQCVADTVKWKEAGKNYGTLYSYDEKGRIKTIEACEPFRRVKKYDHLLDFLSASSRSKKVLAKLVYEYPDKKTIKITNPCCFDNEEEQVCTIKLDEKGLAVEQSYSFYNKQYDKTVYKYDDRNKLIRADYEVAGKKKQTFTYEYDSNGLLIKTKMVYHNATSGQFSEEHIYSYQYY